MADSGLNMICVVCNCLDTYGVIETPVVFQFADMEDACRWVLKDVENERMIARDNFGMAAGFERDEGDVTEESGTFWYLKRAVETDGEPYSVIMTWDIVKPEIVKGGNA